MDVVNAGFLCHAGISQDCIKQDSMEAVQKGAAQALESTKNVVLKSGNGKQLPEDGGAGGIWPDNGIPAPRPEGEELIKFEFTLRFTKLDGTTVIFTRVRPPAGQSIQLFKAQRSDIYEDLLEESRVAG